MVLACVMLSSTLANFGSVVGWSVEVARIAQDADLPFNITGEEQRWLVSSVGIVSIVSTLVTGWLVEIFGPCRLLSALILPQGIAWLTMATSFSLPWLFVGRVCTGGIGVIILTIIQPLLAEICQPDVRGMLSALPEMSVTVGLLGMYTFSQFLQWQTSTLICGLLLLPLLLGVLLVPESPYWFIKNRKEKEARRSLMKLRVPQHNVEDEIAAIRESLGQQILGRGQITQQLCALRNGMNYRPVILLATLFILKELGGAMFIFMFSEYFFTTAEVPWDSYTCTMTVGLIRLIFTFLSALIIDKVGRRPLLIFSSLTCGVAMYVIGGVIKSENENLAWICLPAALVFVACFGLGLGPVPWILMGEMLPTPVRSLAASLCTGIWAVLVFLMTEFMPRAITFTGLNNAVFVFGSINLILAILTWLCVPETRKKNLEELQTAFSGPSVTVFAKARGYSRAYGSTVTEHNSVHI